MSSSDTTKKRKVEGNHAGEGEDTTTSMSAAEESGTLSAILAEMKDMKCKLSRMDELESKSALMQNEIDSMKDRVSHVKELESRSTLLQNELDITKRQCNFLQNEMNGMKDKCTYLETKCDSLERSVEILSKESTWEYSAPEIPESHWDNLEFDEEYIENMLELANGIKRFTCELRSGEYHEISLGEETDEDILNGGRFVQHDDILLPHWKELANAIQLSPSNAFESKRFILQNVQLTSLEMDLLRPALKGKLFNTLYLENNNFVNTSEGVTFAVEVIKSTSQLKKICLVNNQLETMDNVSLVLDAVISHPSIDCIRLENCLGGDINSYQILCSLIASKKPFSSIDLDNNNLQSGGGTAIPDYIASNPPLISLFLSHNRLNDNDATLIAQALKQNTNLERIHLNNNCFTSNGTEAISKAVYDPTSLNSVFECNHICQIDLDGIFWDLPLACKNTDPKNSKTKRSMKMHYILSERNKEGSNVQHLNTEFDEDEDSLKLAPKVLESIQLGKSEVIYKNLPYNYSYGRFVPPMSIMYEVLRGWKMPELFERASGR